MDIKRNSIPLYTKVGLEMIQELPKLQGGCEVDDYRFLRPRHLSVGQCPPMATAEASDLQGGSIGRCIPMGTV